MGNIDRQQETLSEYLKRIMRECRISRVMLAKGSGIALSTLHTYLRGQNPNFHNCRKIAIYLNVPLARIISKVHWDIEEVRLQTFLDLYLDLPEDGRELVEDIALTMLRRRERYKQVREEQEIDG